MSETIKKANDFVSDKEAEYLRRLEWVARVAFNHTQTCDDETCQERTRDSIFDLAKEKERVTRPVPDEEEVRLNRLNKK